MKELIQNTINRCISENPHSDLYRTPLLGFADARDNIFSTLKDVAYNKHLLPQDLLPEAKTVFAFFLPFVKEVTTENRGGSEATRAWAETYANTNNLISQICTTLKVTLEDAGVKMAWLLPTYEFDKKELKAVWSHKHVAYACGLGNFGLNHLLITSKGCSGRFGTGIIDAYIEPTPRDNAVYRCFYHTKDCDYCIRNCPVTALTTGEGTPHNSFSLDRQRCFGQCTEADIKHKDLGSAEVCGKCATGPCGYIK